MACFFDEAFYLSCKLNQLDATGISGETVESLQDAFAAAGLTPLDHYLQFGRSEGLNPNPYFNEYEYLVAKTNQLNAIGESNPFGSGAWTIQDTRAAIAAAGLIPAEHYELYGAFERDATGVFINPSNAFDANTYWSAKLYQLQQNDPDGDWTLDAMLNAFAGSGLSPISHYAAYGAGEVNSSGIAFVQTVPRAQRVENDPSRDILTEDITPANYLSPTPAPTDSNARAAQKPCDVGNLADESVSAPPVSPASSASISDAPPANIKDGAGVTIIPPDPDAAASSIASKWQVVDVKTGKAVVVDSDGTVLGETAVTMLNLQDGSFTVLSSTLNVSSISQANSNSLPPGVTTDPTKSNNMNSSSGSDGSSDGSTSGSDNTSSGNTNPPVVTPQVDGIRAVYNGAHLDISGALSASATASITLNADGSIDSWSGQQPGAVMPSGSFSDGMSMVRVDNALKGGGTLILDVSKVTSDHSAVGGLFVKNEISLSAKSGINAGGIYDDVFILHQDSETGIINLGGTNGNGDVISLAPGGTGNSTLGIVAGAPQDDKLTITGDATNKLEIGIISLAGGDDHLILGKNVEVELLTGELGADTITVGDGAYVKDLCGFYPEDISGQVPAGFYDSGDTITVETGGKVGSIFADAGDDLVTIQIGSLITDAIKLGAGADTVSVSGDVQGLIWGEAGNDTFDLSGRTKAAAGASDVADLVDKALTVADFSGSGVNGADTLYVGANVGTLLGATDTAYNDFNTLLGAIGSFLTSDSTGIAKAFYFDSGTDEYTYVAMNGTADAFGDDDVVVRLVGTSELNGVIGAAGEITMVA